MKTRFLPRKTRSTLGLAIIALGSACGSSSTTAAAPGCKIDTDCKGDRVCDAPTGACVDPTSSAGASSGGHAGSAGAIDAGGFGVSYAGAGGSAAGAGGSVAGAAGKGGFGGSAPDCPGLAAGADCTVVPACGCGANEMCVPKDATGAGKCIAAGVGKSGDACATNAACGAGLGCATDDDNSGNPVHVCYPFFDPNDETASCGIGNFGVDVDGGPAVAPTALQVCAFSCDEVNAQSPVHAGDKPCGAGTACRSYASGQIATTICVSPAGKTPIGGSCTSPDECGAGAACAGTSDSTRTCTKQCYTTADCPSPQHCFAGGEVSICGT